MLLQIVKDFVGRMTYKPDHKFFVYERSHGIEIQLARLTVDARPPHQIDTWLFANELVPFGVPDSDEHLKSVIKQLVVRAELHEIDEWLRLDGEHVTDPHPELTLPGS